MVMPCHYCFYHHLPRINVDVHFQPGGYAQRSFCTTKMILYWMRMSLAMVLFFKGGQSLRILQECEFMLNWGCGRFMNFNQKCYFSAKPLLKDSGLTSDDTPINERVKGSFYFKYNKLHQDAITARRSDFNLKIT